MVASARGGSFLGLERGLDSVGRGVLGFLRGSFDACRLNGDNGRGVSRRPYRPAEKGVYRLIWGQLELPAFSDYLRGNLMLAK